MIETLDMTLICKELVQPYERGLVLSFYNILKEPLKGISVKPFLISPRLNISYFFNLI